MPDYKLSNYMIASQLVRNTWSFKPITFEEILILTINITLTIPITIITSMSTKPPTVNIMSLNKTMIMIMAIKESGWQVSIF